MDGGAPRSYTRRRHPGGAKKMQRNAIVHRFGGLALVASIGISIAGTASAGEEGGSPAPVPSNSISACFIPYGTLLSSESDTQVAEPACNPQLTLLSASVTENILLNLGSGATGSGPGKVTFNPMNFTAAGDAAASALMLGAASSTPYDQVRIDFKDSSGRVTLELVLKLVSFQTVTISDTVGPGNMPTIGGTLLYGGFQVRTPSQQQGSETAR